MLTAEERIKQIVRDNKAAFHRKRKPSKFKHNPASTPKKMEALRASTILATHHEEVHHARLGEYAAYLYKEKVMTDVIVVVQGHEFKAHKAVLACYSPYFKEVFTTPGFNNAHHVQIASVTANAFEILLEYMYTGELNLTCQELSDVYRAARNLGMRDALGKCAELMNVTPGKIENMVYLYVTARKLNVLDPSVRAFKMMLDNFESLLTTKEFLDLEVNQLTEVLSADEIGARSEVPVYLAALKWINHKYLDREEYVVPVMCCVRFSLMNMEEILACYHPPLLPGILHIPVIRQALLNATCYIASKSLGQESLFPEFADKPRRYLFKDQQLLLWDVFRYDPNRYHVSRRYEAATTIQAAFRGYMTRKFLKEDLHMAHLAAVKIQASYRGYKTRKSLDVYRKSKLKNKTGGRRRRTVRRAVSSNSYLSMSSSLSSLNLSHPEPKERILYVMGATDMRKKRDGGENGLFSFTPEDNEWDLLTKCPYSLHDSRMVSMKGSLYVLGGCNPALNAASGRALPQNDCYKFELRRKEWRSLPGMNQARSFHGAAVLGGTIYVAGGKDESNNILSTMESYNPRNDCWTEIHVDLPEPRMAMGFAAHHGMLWIAGGITPDGHNIAILDSVRCIDLRVGRWISKCCLPQPIAFPSLLTYGNQLLCLGGATKPGRNMSGELTSLDGVYAYEVHQDMWTLMCTMPLQCHSVVACSSGKDLYVLGGFTTQLMSSLPNPFHYSARDETWQNINNLPAEAHGFVTTACSV